MAIRSVLFIFPKSLARIGVIDREKGEEAFDLAIPVMVTGGIRIIMRVADFFMVSLALGDAAIAGLEFGFQYFFIGFGLALGMSSGTISVVSRLKGAEDHDEADFALKQSVWLALLIAIPLTTFTWFFSEELIGVLTDKAATIDYGSVYLRIVMLSFAFRFWSMIAARALAGSGDTRTPMYVRLVTIPTNLVLNALLIFGVGPFPQLGVAGAALGTAIANTLAAGVFLVLLLTDRFPIRLRLGGKQWDTGIAREIVRVGYPLAGMQLIKTLGRFPFLFILAAIGTPVVAAYAIARRVMLLAMMPAWGYSTASSTLVGQSIGAGNDSEADEYGWQTLRLALATQLLIGGILVIAARPITLLFNTENVGLTVNFIRVFGVGVAAFSISRTMRGGLRGAGDTKWPLYGTIAGTVLRLPIAALALPTTFAVSVFGLSLQPGLGLGVIAIYVALMVDMYTKAGVNVFRFWTGKWKEVARESGVGAGPQEQKAD